MRQIKNGVIKVSETTNKRCPECNSSLTGRLPSYNGRVHTCPNKKKRDECENYKTCPLCQTCLRLRMEYLDARFALHKERL